MVWGCFSARGMPKLKIIEGNLNSDGCCWMMYSVMIPFAENEYTGEWHFQQHYASMHTSKPTVEFFCDRVVFLMDMTACSPDLNTIESLWGILVRIVYKDFRQLNTSKDVQEAIETARVDIDPELLKN